jgi:hypothetical protein
MNKTKAQLSQWITELQVSLDTAHKQQLNERNMRINAENEIKETRKQFADLKERLHKAELQNAENEGYLRRVREDDAVADPLIEIEGPEGKRMVSKRYPSYGHSTMTPYNSFDKLYNNEKRKHWVNY